MSDDLVTITNNENPPINLVITTYNNEVDIVVVNSIIDELTTLKTNYAETNLQAHSHDNKSELDLVSGTNTGDETSSTIVAKLGYTPASQTLENRHYVGTTGEPAFQNNWVTAGSGILIPNFFKDNFGIVHLEGMISGGTANTVAFTLPLAYRPSKFLHFPVIKSGVLGEIDINTDGTVLVVTYSSGNWISLDNISFRASGS